ncbi:hypothetical protein E2C01_069088 [Portunus trituberculatus]|uniref:Uncharacterized protein n=1 Tax=Portunus trituberculatus TaxID=210409 RepID=A0A5B7I1V8_PORTR|nr:hypothetical protein [Portunus trituberculatus]
MRIEKVGGNREGTTVSSLRQLCFGAFHRVWHKSLITKIRADGIDGALLSLLEDYLSNRHLRVTISHRESDVLPIKASLTFSL